MIVKCIDNRRVCLTIGKKYEVERETRDMYVIVNDIGFKKLYPKFRFVVIKEEEECL